MNYEQRVREALKRHRADATKEAGAVWTEDQATQAILSLIREAKREELETLPAFVANCTCFPCRIVRKKLTELKAEAEL